MTTEKRLERLERELTAAKRHNRWLLTAAGLVVLTLVLARVFSGTMNTAQAQGKGSEKKVVRANEFILEDDKNRIRAVLCMSEVGPGLSLYGDRGEVRALMQASNDGSRLALYDQKGELRAVMEVGKDDEPVLSLKRMKIGEGN